MISWIFGIVAITAPTPLPAANDIVIRSCVNCSERSLRETVHIIRNERSYHASSGATIDPRPVAELIAAVLSQQIDQLDLRRIITHNWIEANEPAAESDLLTPPTASQAALFARSFRNLDLMRKTFASYYPNVSWTDDYPLVQVVIKLEDGRSVLVFSNVQKEYMLPWRVSFGESQLVTYNEDISRAVGALLPLSAANEGRLSGARLATQLGRELVSSLGPKWIDAQMHDLMPVAYARLQSNYEIEENQGVGCFSGYDAGACPLWLAKVRSRQLKENVAFSVELPFGNGAVQETGQIKRAVANTQRALRIPWLRRYLAANPEVELRVSVDRTGSFGPEAQQSFVDSMRQVKRDPLAIVGESVADVLHAYLSYRDVNTKLFESEWLIFPSGKAVLWFYLGFPGPLGPKSFATLPSANCFTDLEMCTSGVVVDVDGNLLSRT